MKTNFVLSREPLHRIGGVVAGALLLASSILSAQNATPRITESVNDSSRVTLKGNVSAVVRAAIDKGAVPASTPMTQVRLELKRSDAQQAALERYLTELQQKSSPNYHKWLTPEQFGALYGPADSDIAAIVAWLQSQGLTVESVSKGKTNIAFSGTAGQIAKAFKTPIHSFQLNGREFYANTAEPTIPAALSGVVSGVMHLNTLSPRPMSHHGTPATLDKNTGRFTPATAASGETAPGAALHPDLSLSINGANYLYVVPGDAATIYNTPNSFNANFSSGTSYNGTGVTIGIGGDATVSTTPVVNYRTAFLGDTTAPTITYVGTGTIGTSDADEAFLDMEVSGGLAPGAAVHYYASADLYSAIQKALDDNTVDIFSLSFGACELAYSTADNQGILSWWQQAAVQGIAVTVSSGDNGSAGCDATSDSSGNSVTAATQGLQVNALASTAYNISVGGTDYYTLESNFGTYATVPPSGGSAGSAATFFRTAKQYIPESTWNDSTSNNTTISANTAWSAASGNQNIVAGSGGKSACSTNTTIDTTTQYTVGTCTSGYSKPSWQRGTGVPSDSARDLPDVSLLAGNGLYGAAWSVCDNYSSGGVTYNCSDVANSMNVDGIGGTSAAAPAFAGMLALVQQSQGGGRLGQAAENLYNLFNNSASTIFHDVTVGNISVPCTSGTTNCSQNTAGYYYESGYNTTAGYDLATGLGSVDVSALITNWSNSTGTAAATVTVTPASSTVNVANSLDVTIAVGPSSPVPSGSVTLKSGTYTSAVTNLNSGSASITIPANSLAVGIDTLTATYSGDGTYSSATGTAMVTVDAASLTPTTTTLSASSTTPTQGTSITLNATVAPSAATGTIKFYDGTNLLSTQNVSSGAASYATSALAVGAHTLTAVYSGDTTYASSTSTAVTVTVAAAPKGSFTMAFSPSTLTVKRGSSGTETLMVTPANSYTGTVTFSVSTSNDSALTNLCVFAGTGFNSNGSLTVSGTSPVSGTVTIDTNGSCGTTGASVPVGTHGKRLLPRGNSTHAGNRKSNSSIPGGLAFAGLLLAGLLGRSSRKLRGLACVVALAAVAFGLSACSSSSGGSSGPSDPPKGTYTITVTGQDTNDSTITAQSSFTLTIN